MSVPGNIRKSCLDDPENSACRRTIELGFCGIGLKSALYPRVSLEFPASDFKVFTRPNSSKTPGRNWLAMFFTDRIKFVVVADSDLIFSCNGRCPGVNLRDIQDNPKCKLVSAWPNSSCNSRAITALSFSRADSK